MIARFKKTSRPRWAGAVLLLAALASVVLTNAYVAKADIEFGGLVNLKLVVPILDAAYDAVNCFSSDGLEMYIMRENRPGGYGGWDLWVLRRTSKDDDWGPPQNLGPALNTSKDDNWATISTDGLTLYFNSNQPGGYGSHDVYMTTRATRDAPWGQAVNLGPKINSSVGDASPWISADGLELFFMSFRAGGHGRGDIYVATRGTRNDPWGDPVNLGPLVNSAYTEVFPCLSADGLQLFFSDGLDEAARPGGYGGADLWMTRRASLSEPWQPPVNLGPQVNRSIQELGLRISPDGCTLYFYTNSAGTWENWQVPILPMCDFNEDGLVDCVDICMLVDHLDTNEPLYDIAPVPFGDGIVDAQDLVVLTEHLTKKQADPNAVTP